MAEITLHATPRTPQGTRTVRRLRGEGKIPGVVYGLGDDPINLTVDWQPLRAALVTDRASTRRSISTSRAPPRPRWSRTCSATRCAATSSTSTSCGST